MTGTTIRPSRNVGEATKKSGKAHNLPSHLRNPRPRTLIPLPVEVETMGAKADPGPVTRFMSPD